MVFPPGPVLVTFRTELALKALPLYGNANDPAPMAMPITATVEEPLFTLNRYVPSARPPGKFATIFVLVDDSSVRSTASNMTTGGPDAGIRCVPPMVISLVDRFTMALSMVGFAANANEVQSIIVHDMPAPRFCMPVIKSPFNPLRCFGSRYQLTPSDR